MHQLRVQLEQARMMLDTTVAEHKARGPGAGLASQQHCRVFIFRRAAEFHQEALQTAYEKVQDERAITEMLGTELAQLKTELSSSIESSTALQQQLAAMRSREVELVDEVNRLRQELDAGQHQSHEKTMVEVSALYAPLRGVAPTPSHVC
jgi:hypothetical protein